METRFQQYNRTHAAQRVAYEENVRPARRHVDRKRMQKKRGKAKRFISWDGEGSRVEPGQPQPYMLFGNSDGQLVKSRQLQTAECLNLILRSPKDAIHFGFAFGYDVNQILVDLKLPHLWVLARHNSVRWNGYQIQYIPGKWFQVRRRINGEMVTRKIFDVFHYFNRALVDVLEEYEIGTPEERKYLAEQKANRPDFTWAEIEEVVRYWTLEGRLMVELMEYMRKLFNDAGFYPTSWHGPGALARIMLKNHGIKSCLVNTREIQPEVWIAARYGFTGGRFQQWLAGFYDGSVYNYDIHSAYPYAIQFLPNLATGKWCYNKRVNRGQISRNRFCLYHIKYDAREHEGKDTSYFAKCRPRPLFRRLKNDNIYWPDKVEGWYWSPEAELVKDDPAAEFIEAWEFADDGTRPFKFIADIYNTREHHKALGNAIEYAFKLAMNSAYGQFAQRAGWKQQRPPGPPPFHQLEYAGYITSMCKAMVHQVASYAYDNGGLITIDTDGIYSTVQIPDYVLPNGIGDGLGQWEEAKYQGMLIYQNGFYWLKKHEEWSKARSRGAPRGKVPIDAAWEAMEYLDPIKYDKTMFIGFKLALKAPKLHWRSWTPVPHEVRFGGGKGTKMGHAGPMGKERTEAHKAVRARGGRWGDCRKCNGMFDHQMHDLKPFSAVFDARREYEGTQPKFWSYMHNLPWLETDEQTADYVDDEEIMAEIYKDVNL
jgi:hypothetical protein